MVGFALTDIWVVGGLYDVELCPSDSGNLPPKGACGVANGSYISSGFVPFPLSPFPDHFSPEEISGVAGSRKDPFPGHFSPEEISGVAGSRKDSKCRRRQLLGGSEAAGIPSQHTHTHTHTSLGGTRERSDRAPFPRRAPERRGSMSNGRRFSRLNSPSPPEAFSFSCCCCLVY